MTKPVHTADSHYFLYVTTVYHYYYFYFFRPFKHFVIVHTHFFPIERVSWELGILFFYHSCQIPKPTHTRKKHCSSGKNSSISSSTCCSEYIICSTINFTPCSFLNCRSIQHSLWFYFIFYFFFQDPIWQLTAEIVIECQHKTTITSNINTIRNRKSNRERNQPL